MKTLTKILLGFVAALSMVLFACSKDEPTQAQEPDTPVIPAHPEKDWQGELPHGFIIDAKEFIIPTSERGFIEFTLFDGKVLERYDEIEINWDADPYRFGSPKLSPGYYHQDTDFLIEGEMADPFENPEEYVNLCIQHKFRWKSRFSETEELKGYQSPVYGGYVCTENLTSVNVITENYFDINHPAGSSMRLIEGVGMSIRVIPVNFVLLSRGYNWNGPGYPLGLGYTYEKKAGRNPLQKVMFTVCGFPEKAGEYPMILKVAMNGGEKTWEQRFTIKFVDKK